MAAINAFHEVKQVMKFTPLSARGNNRFNRTTPGALYCAQSIADGACIGRIKTIRSEIDIGREECETDGACIIGNELHLVGEIHDAAHVGCHEFRREVRLQISRLVGDQRVGSRVRLVEAVAGKLLHEIEQLIRNTPGDALINSTFSKDAAMLGHFLGLLFTHRATQQIGTAQRVAADRLRDLHHLLLIDHDAQGRR